MALYYTTEKIGPKRSLTPEGYLLCHDVPIARTGEMVYLAQELMGAGVTPGRDGIIRVQRSADDVFLPETIASFEGKPVTDDHPAEDVTAANWREFACGSVQHVRREGEMLVADMLVTVADVIDDVRTGKREVSCGYSAEYAQIGDGVARQFNILGNHVAIVRAGRCGPTCSIGDSKVTVKKTRADRILEAVKTGDADALEASISSTVPEIHVHTHLTRDAEDPDDDEEKKKTEDEDPDDKDDKEEEKTSDEDPIAAVNERMDRIEDSIAKMRDSIAKLAKDEEPEGSGKKDDEDLDAPGADTGNLESLNDPGISVDPGEVKGTTDSRGLVDQFRETLSVAEILAPGIGLPTFDARASGAKTSDALCGLRRRALTSAYADADKRELVAKVLAGRKPEFAKMTCDAIYGLFAGAGALVRDANNKRPYAGVTFGSNAGTSRPSVADFAAKAAEMWARK